MRFRANTQLSYTWDPVKGYVNTTWSVTTEVMKGTERAIIQGWIPHHYRQTVNDLQFNDLEYLTPRGPRSVRSGMNSASAFPSTASCPICRRRSTSAARNDYEPARIHTYLASCAPSPSYGDDTYWGGKDILRFGQYALMAQQTNDATYQTFVNEPAHGHGRLVHLHARRTAATTSPTTRTGRPWSASSTSYGSESFNDHHFHYGYFTLATALLGHARPPSSWPTTARWPRLVAKEYANWDRTDKRFPFLRTFDIWAGPLLGRRHQFARRQQPGILLRGRAVLGRPDLPGRRPSGDKDMTASRR